MRVRKQIPITGLSFSTFWNFLTSVFFENFGENHKNVVSRKLLGFEQSYLEAKIATPKRTLTEPHHRDANIKFCEIFYF